jgi:hypothetical protein
MVGAPGFEPGTPRPPVTVESADLLENKLDSHSGELSHAPVNATSGHSSGHSDAVEVALAGAITAAVSAGQWEVVSQLGRELEARRKARATTVDLDIERARRRR